MLREQIYYADQVQSIINDEFLLIDTAPWCKLYKQKADGTFWRVDEWDKYQEQYFVRIDDYNTWKEFDDTNFRIELLKKSRGTTEKQCAWNLCTNKALKALAFCERHAYLEMGVRR